LVEQASVPALCCLCFGRQGRLPYLKFLFEKKQVLVGQASVPVC